MSGMNGTQFRVFIVVLGGLSATPARRSFMQTLQVGVGCEGALDLLSGLVAGNPGWHSRRLACPGLRYGALSGLRKSEIPPHRYLSP